MPNVLSIYVTDELSDDAACFETYLRHAIKDRDPADIVSVVFDNQPTFAIVERCRATLNCLLQEQSDAETSQSR